MLKINELITQKRKDLGFSQQQLAQEAGVSLPTIQSIEAGRANLSHSTLEQIMDALGLKIQIVSKEIDWDKAALLGVPITSQSPKEILSSKKFTPLLDNFLKTLPTHKAEMMKDPRPWEAFTAFLLAVQGHYPKAFKKLKFHKKAQKILDQNMQIFDAGRLIKLRRIALAEVSKYL